MHTLVMTAAGLALLAVFFFGANEINKRRPARPMDGALAFIWLWLFVSLINFFVGVFVAGYSVLTELGVHAVIFGVPALIAWYLSRRLSAVDKATGGIH